MDTKEFRAATRSLARAGAVALLLLAVAGETTAQEVKKEKKDKAKEATAGVVKKEKKKEDGWETRWKLSLGSEYDDNLFALKSGQKTKLGEGKARYEGMESPRDVIHSIRMRGELRGPGLLARQSKVGAAVRYDAYTLNTLRSGARFELFAAEKLSKRDEVGVELSFSPSEFRRSYLIGGGSGAPEYTAGEAKTLSARLEYEREILRGKGGGPELSATLALVGGQRTYANLPWRDRGEVGGEIESDLRLGKRIALELSAGRVRASHDPQDEPVYDKNTGAVHWAVQERDFDETALGAETRLRFSGKREIAFRYDHRVRDYLATGGKYAGRQDTRQSYGAEFDLLAGKRAGLVLGGAYVDQTTLRPGSGDTGDETDFTRSSVYLRMDISR